MAWSRFGTRSPRTPSVVSWSIASMLTGMHTITWRSQKLLSIISSGYHCDVHTNQEEVMLGLRGVFTWVTEFSKHLLCLLLKVGIKCLSSTSRMVTPTWFWYATFWSGLRSGTVPILPWFYASHLFLFQMVQLTLPPRRLHHKEGPWLQFYTHIWRGCSHEYEIAWNCIRPKPLFEKAPQGGFCNLIGLKVQTTTRNNNLTRQRTCYRKQ